MKTGTFFRQAAKILAFLALVTGIGVIAGHILNTNVRSFDRTDTKKAAGAPVSYTHLDVYKRQGMLMVNVTMITPSILGTICLIIILILEPPSPLAAIT